MKKNMICLLLFSALLSSCMEETFNLKYVSESEIGKSPQALDATARATIAFMTAYQPFSQTANQQIGYAGYNIIRDMLTADMPSTTTSFDQFNNAWGSLGSNLSAGNPIIHPWRWYYGMVNLTNITIRAIGEPEGQTQRVRNYYGQACFHRALAYFDLCRMYEHRPSGVAALDNVATQDDFWGLTSIIIDEHTPDTQLDNNPRRPYWHMYRFILTDLNKAEKYLAGYARAAKNEPNVDVVNAFKARFWLEVATRFQLQPDDLTKALSHENDPDLADYDKLNITSASDCYQRAADYAQKVIDAGYAPLTESEWFDVNNGFNDSSVSSWVFGAIMGGEAGYKDSYFSFTGHMSLEFTHGFNGLQSRYTPVYRMIGRSLYDEMGAADWRKTTWIDPADARTAPGTKYETTFTDAEFRNIPAYAGFKFRPRGGRDSTKQVIGSTGDIPFVRVEEMHFIKMEATAYLNGLDAGKDALNAFMNTYRYTDGSYSSENATDLNDFVNNFLLVQKRIEFWGEGLTYFDLKRRNQPVIRGYSGTNFRPTHTFNSVPGYACGWFTFHFPRSQEVGRNPAVKQNPVLDVATNFPIWTE